MLLQPNKKSVKKLREVLHELYKHLDSSAAAIIDVSQGRGQGMEGTERGQSLFMY